jgi:hypothetical protein
MWKPVFLRNEVISLVVSNLFEYVCNRKGERDEQTSTVL